MTFADKMQILMATHSLTQAEMASRLGCSQPAISQYVTGEREPTTAQLAKIKNAFGVTYDWLLGDDQNFTAGIFIKNTRENKGLTLRDCQNRVNKRISNAHLSQLETGRNTNPSLKMVFWTAKALELDPNVLAKMFFTDMENEVTQ